MGCTDLSSDTDRQARFRDVSWIADAHTDHGEGPSKRKRVNWRDFRIGPISREGWLRFRQSQVRGTTARVDGSQDLVLHPVCGRASVKGEQQGTTVRKATLFSGDLGN